MRREEMSLEKRRLFVLLAASMMLVMVKG